MAVEKAADSAMTKDEAKKENDQFQLTHVLAVFMHLCVELNCPCFSCLHPTHAMASMDMRNCRKNGILRTWKKYVRNKSNLNLKNDTFMGPNCGKCEIRINRN